jgi:hypothetical protein
MFPSSTYSRGLKGKANTERTSSIAVNAKSEAMLSAAQEAEERYRQAIEITLRIHPKALIISFIEQIPYPFFSGTNCRD